MPMRSLPYGHSDLDGADDECNRCSAPILPNNPDDVCGECYAQFYAPTKETP